MTKEKAERGFKKKMFDYWGFFEEENLLGFILLKREGDILWIKNLLINRNFRGRGLGKRLIKKSFSIAKKNKIRIRTEVFIKNKEVLLFFKKLGFKEVSVNKEKQYILEY
jgi:N-acetylglutamate synthase-like GNAT family acetyltransferase